MRTLVLTGESPVPATFGLRLRVLHLARELARAADVEVAFNSPPPPGPAEGEPFRLTELPLEWGQPRWEWARRVWLPYEIAIPRGRPMRRLAAQRRPDTVVAHTLPLVRPALGAGAPLILDSHNVATDVGRSLGAGPLDLLKTARHERATTRRVAAVCAVSDEDAARFERWGARRVVVVPNGVDTAAIEYAPPAPGSRLLYAGNFEWRPNTLAARDLVAGVLPRVRAAEPSARLTLVGHWPGEPIEESPGVEVAGVVPDVMPYLRAARAVVVPLRAGGGTRLKVLEALAAGVPVVSTPFGVKGLSLADGRHCLLATTPQGLADQVVRVIRDDGLANALSAAGRAHVERLFDWSVAGGPLVDLNERLAAGA